MSKQQSRQLSQEEASELKAQLRKEIRKVWTLEDLENLKAELARSSYKLFLRYLHLLEEHLAGEVWEARSWEHYNFLRGQHHSLVKLLRIPEEIDFLSQELREKEEDKE